MKIKFNEILVSIVIFSLLITLGLNISDAINSSLLNKYQEYNTAVKISDNKELFEYALRTNVGNAFIHGDLIAADPIVIDDISGSYAYIEREEQHYQRHSRTVTYTDSDGKRHTKTEYYWQWDTVDTDSWHCSKLSFLGVTFKYDQIPLPRARYLTTINSGYHVRYLYYVNDTKYIGTIYTNISNNTINNTKFYDDQNITDVIAKLESRWEIYLFWSIWIVLSIAIVIVFYYLDNRWLD
jgi:hypothetical protein